MSTGGLHTKSLLQHNWLERTLEPPAQSIHFRELVRHVNQREMTTQTMLSFDVCGSTRPDLEFYSNWHDITGAGIALDLTDLTDHNGRTIYFDGIYEFHVFCSRNNNGAASGGAIVNPLGGHYLPWDVTMSTSIGLHVPPGGWHSSCFGLHEVLGDCFGWMINPSNDVVRVDNLGGTTIVFVAILGCHITT